MSALYRCGARANLQSDASTRAAFECTRSALCQRAITDILRHSFFHVNQPNERPNLF